MIDNRLSLFLGKPVLFNGVKISSPSIEKIEQIGETEYRIKYLLSTFNKDKTLAILFEMTEKELDTFSDIDDYQVLTSDQRIIKLVCNSISFFLDDEIEFDYSVGAFTVNNKLFITSENYRQFVSLLHLINGSNHTTTQKLKYKNKRAEMMAKELEKMRAKNKKSSDDGLELKDLLSILCADEGNGIDIFNVHKLTVYQVTEQFERLGIKYNRNTILPVWANGHLKEGSKLPELLVKTKF